MRFAGAAPLTFAIANACCPNLGPRRINLWLAHSFHHRPLRNACIFVASTSTFAVRCTCHSKSCQSCLCPEWMTSPLLTAPAPTGHTAQTLPASIRHTVHRTPSCSRCHSGSKGIAESPFPTPQEIQQVTFARAAIYFQYYAFARLVGQIWEQRQNGLFDELWPQLCVH